MKKTGKLLKRLIFIVISIYAIVTFFNQQKILNTYASNNKTLSTQIEEANKHQQELAREKLDMYLPNERVYINNDN